VPVIRVVYARLLSAPQKNSHRVYLEVRIPRQAGGGPRRPPKTVQGARCPSGCRRRETVQRPCREPQGVVDDSSAAVAVAVDVTVVAAAGAAAAGWSGVAVQGLVQGRDKSLRPKG
jgi:hypothetical protein